MLASYYFDDGDAMNNSSLGREPYSRYEHQKFERSMTPCGTSTIQAIRVKEVLMERDNRRSDMLLKKIGESARLALNTVGSTNAQPQDDRSIIAIRNATIFCGANPPAQGVPNTYYRDGKSVGS